MATFTAAAAQRRRLVAAGDGKRLPRSSAVLVWIAGSLVGWAVITLVVLSLLRGLDSIVGPDETGPVARDGAAPASDDELATIRAVEPAAGAAAGTD